MTLKLSGAFLICLGLIFVINLLVINKMVIGPIKYLQKCYQARQEDEIMLLLSGQEYRNLVAQWVLPDMEQYLLQICKR